MENISLTYHVKGGDFTNGGSASSSVKKVMKQLNIDPAVIRKTVVALYEAEVNVVAHANEGDVFVEINTEKIEIKIVDKGPGISDIDLAMQEGYSTASNKVREMGFGAGMGLPNIKSNSDKLKINSEVGIGTVVIFTNLFEQNG